MAQDPIKGDVGGRRLWWIIAAVAVAAAILAAATATLYVAAKPSVPLPIQPPSALAELSEEQTVPLAPGDWARPVWHPSGAALVCTEVQEQGSQLWLVPLDGSSPTPLTSGPGRHTTASGRVWVRRGLLYSSDERGEEEIWLLETDTFRRRVVGFAGGTNRDASWAADERRIVLVRREYGAGTAGVWLATAKGLERPLPSSADTTGEPSLPAWSSDGSKVMFQLGSPGTWDLRLVTLGGDPLAGGEAPAAPPVAAPTTAPAMQGATSTTAPATPEATPAASASEATGSVTPLLVGPGEQKDGAWVGIEDDALFVDSPAIEQPAELFAIVGGTVVRLTRNDTPEGAPSPSPDGSRVAFERGEPGRRCVIVARLVRGAAPR